MAQEFTIKSEQIESKINQLLPSQGGFGAGVDFSASTMVIPIVDLTETAEGSSLRQDLQTSFSHDTMTSFETINTTTDIVTTPGYWRVFGNGSVLNSLVKIQITDGTTTKILFYHQGFTAAPTTANFDVIIKAAAGDTIQAFSISSNGYIAGAVRQLADVSGNLVNP